MNKKERAKRLNEMRRLYENEKWTLEEIGKHFGVTRQAIHDRFKRAGIKLREPKRSTPRFDRDTLIHLYEEQKLSILEVAEKLKSSRKTVTKELKRHHIKIRSKHFYRRKQPELFEMKVGEVIELKRPEVKNPYSNFHVKALAIGTKISMKRIDEDTFQVTRIK